MKKRKRFVSVVALLLAFLMVFSLVASALSMTASAVSQSDVDALEEQKNTLSQQKEAKKAALDALRGQQADFVAMKTALDEKNELVQQEINVIIEQIDMYSEMILEKEQEAQEAQNAADEQLVVYKDHLRNMEENGSFNFYLSVLFSSKNFSDLISRIDMITEIMENDKAIEDSYKAARDFSLEVKAEYESYKTELTDKQTVLEEEMEQLKQEIAEAGQMIADLQADIDAYTAEYNKMEADEASVRAQIDALTKQLQEEEEERRRAEEAANAANEANNGGESEGGNTPETPPATNSTVTGSYIWPAPASTYVTSAYGYRIHPIFGTEKYHAGIDIGAGAGTNVVAADGGTVSVATYSSSYGNYVMVYHSDGSSTLYAHMSSLAVSAGQTVSQGDVLGYVGETGWANGPHLHFEVRVNGSTVDPLGYFSNYSLAPDA